MKNLIPAFLWWKHNIVGKWKIVSKPLFWLMCGACGHLLDLFQSRFPADLAGRVIDNQI